MKELVEQELGAVTVAVDMYDRRILNMSADGLANVHQWIFVITGTEGQCPEEVEDAAGNLHFVTSRILRYALEIAQPFEERLHNPGHTEEPDEPGD